MLYTLLIAVLIVTICLILLGIKIIFVKGGKFPNTHIGANKAMRDRGINCVQSQDREARQKSHFSLKDIEKSLQDNL